MKLLILDNVLEFPNKEEVVEDLFNEIDKVLQDRHYFLSHFVVDGVEIYQDYEEYLLENIASIEEIRVEVKILKELVEEVLLSTKDYLQRAVPLVKDLGEAFYQTPKEESWQSLADLLGGIQWILQSFVNIDQNKHLEEIVPSYELWNEYVQHLLKLNDNILDLHSAVENQDMVLIADMLTYEINPIFEEMFQKLQEMLPEEVYNSHAN
ncbi:hypothetical protein SAMN05660297_00695 [Natronincola peptidivorans]|uniref:Uncharacterized protein n=1 Tax=Natronincola peptidivorans TaxID=426128 RepID=A0A1H9ZT64_9FIRM|nr:hypothetical protein [Natronincola peptidivorans]SES84461.1 hypothetical protein SAMN05660297_00695 [Natronincola peptidivorans]